MLSDRRTDMTKIIIAFVNFANAPKNEKNFFVCKETLGSNFMKIQQSV